MVYSTACNNVKLLINKINKNKKNEIDVRVYDANEHFVMKFDISNTEVKSPFFSKCSISKLENNINSMNVKSPLFIMDIQEK